jgi:hypothetical protein
MKQQPAVFLKLLVLLVPREMKIEHSGGVKAMTDEQLEQGIEAIQAMLAQRDAGASAKVIEAVPEPAALPAPPRKAKRKVRKSERDVDQRVDAESAAARPAPFIAARLCRNERPPPDPHTPIDRVLPVVLRRGHNRLGDRRRI